VLVSVMVAAGVAGLEWRGRGVRWAVLLKTVRLIRPLARFGG
jgi:hypothetical protein